MSIDRSGDKRDWKPFHSTNTKQRSQSSDDDVIHSHNSDTDSRSPSNESSTGDSARSLIDNSYSDVSDSREGQKMLKSPGKGFTEQTTAQTETKKSRVYQAISKVGSKGFLWRKSISWKQSCAKTEHLQGAKTENNITKRILSAEFHKVKELTNELYNVQRALESVNSENKVLTRLQHRHMKALQKFESDESSLHQLICRHNSEVRALKENLKTSQEHERNLSKKLKETESELLKTKDQLQKLQKLSEDKNLAEREELNNKLSNLLIKMDMYDNKVKALERKLHLTVTFYDRQIDFESKNVSDARDTTKKLQTEILSLQKKIKEKERELDIKNIYANRMPRDLYKYESRFCQRGLTLAKGTQTLSEMFIQALPNKHQVEEQTDHKDNENEIDRARDEENNCQITGEAFFIFFLPWAPLPTGPQGTCPSCPIGKTPLAQWSNNLNKNEESPVHEFQQSEENENFLEIDARKQEQDCEIEILGDKLDTFLGKEHEMLQATIQFKNSMEDELFNENKVEAERREESSDANLRTSFLPRLRKHYKFTVATENLHQGLPATGPISSFGNIRRNLMLQGESSLGYEPSFSKVETNKWNDVREEKMEKSTEVSLYERKNNLMEELFGPGYSLKNNYSSPVTTPK
ncbi:lebercilin-like protein isoform X2 [Mixophyes fleayi]|uniref:lebercilin-like protein isoform X2 n=1 Tax=Mixophyes fleayi TaxID=3061075 RepID=UPI003F4E1BA8